MDSFQLLKLGNPTRLKLLEELCLKGPSTTSTLSKRFRMNPGTINHHLQELTAVGLTLALVNGRRTLYCPQPAPLKALAQSFSKLGQECEWTHPETT